MTEQINLHTDNYLTPFDAINVPLDGSNLIEASAGTGKTYSIAILALRLLMEKEYSIKEILMVTFTKAAVAELEERIRLFVRQAVLVSQGIAIKDKSITQIVSQCTEQKTSKQVQDLLNSALTFLDETSVMTIHSFCQQALREFAFETKQPFGTELLVDDKGLLTAGLNQFWRSKIAPMPLPLLTLAIDKDTRKTIGELVRNEQAGKPFYAYQPANDYPLDDNYYAQATEQLQNLTDQIQREEERLLIKVQQEWQEMITAMNKSANAVRLLSGLTHDPQKFMLTILLNKDKNYNKKAYGSLIEEAENWFSLKALLDGFKQSLNNYIYCAAIQQISAYIQSEKEKQNQLSFDDLIGQLHLALTSPDHHKLVAGLRQKYKAIFIDEFQDTDRLQYEIFQTAFGKETIIFYIGDPKQSIYAFRSADIDTYLKASKEVDHSYGMNINFRSADLFIQGMNAFFLPEPDFDTFAFDNQTEKAFGYIPVKSPALNNKGELIFNGAPAAPLDVIVSSNKAQTRQALVTQVAMLLNDTQFAIRRPIENGNESDLPYTDKRIVPSDLGILVNSNSDARFYKMELSKRGIPAIVIGDDKILTSPEATIVQYLLEAMLDLSRTTINRALLNTLTGYNAADVLALSDTETIDRFKQYKLFWERDGIYKALFAFVSDFEVLPHLLSAEAEAGERIITNLYQLIELLHKNQTLKNYAPIEVIDWLKRGIEQEETLGDEYTQRIENDSNSVTIITIHKSKGLQFNIVLSASLDMKTDYSAQSQTEAFKDSQAQYITIPKKQINKEQETLYKQQAEQENRRKLYVALTRAVYKCFIFRNEYIKSSTLVPFIQSIMANPGPLIQFKEGSTLPKGYRYHPVNPENEYPPVTASDSKTGQPVQFSLTQKDWTRLSYTFLAAGRPIPYRRWNENKTTDYDHFIFHELARGNQTGNMLHDIFENIFFGNENYWEAVVESAVKRFAPTKTALYQKPLLTLLREVLHTEIHVGDDQFALNSVDTDHRMHEFEFDFPVKTFQTADLQFLAENNRQIQLINRENLEGLMNGKVDLLFERGNKFYILDWKSTFLGSSLADYGPDALEEAMNIHNYHLQYLIYTVAVHKYLASRMPDFDYERDFGGVIYVFLRGVRQGKDTGLYTVKPPKHLVDQLGVVLSGK